MIENSELVGDVQSLSKDTLVTLNDDEGAEYSGKVQKFRDRRSGYYVWVCDPQTHDPFFKINTHGNEVEAELTGDTASGGTMGEPADIETHGIRVDWDEPVSSSESGLTYVVDCDECGGIMVRDGQHWPRSAESYACKDCDNTGRWPRSSDKVRKPTRREWAEHKLTDPRPHITIADRYVPDGYEKPGYYFREVCPNDEDHYKRCIVSETGTADLWQFSDKILGVCTECGAETKHKTRTYEDGLEEWGEPEDLGDRFPDGFEDAIESVRTGEVALLIKTSPDEDYSGYVYEGIKYERPWLTYGDHDMYVVSTDDGLYGDIVGAGGRHINSEGRTIGNVAWLFKHADDAELVPRDDYERKMNAQPA